MITTSLVSLFLLQTPTASAKEVFLKTMDHYGKLDSFSADLEHDYSSGLFAGKYKQHLEFKKGKGFTLIVTSHKGSNRPKDVAPDYFCDGVDVMTKVTHEGVRPLNKDPNLMPGYEVTGGLIVTWLLDSSTKRFFSKPPNGVETSIEWGPRETWHEQKVDEIVFKMKMGKESNTVSLFIDPDHKKFIGTEAMNNGKLGYMLYGNQKENSTVNAKAFKPPAK